MSHLERRQQRVEKPVNPDAEKTKTPIIIRAHHLDRVRQAFLETPSVAAADLASVILEDFSAWNKRDRDYATDVMGAPYNHDKFKNSVENVLEELIDASDDHPVYLVSGQPDGICGACTIGKHCGMKIHNGYVNIINFDNSYLKSFLIAARKIGEDPEMVVSQREFPDSIVPEDVRTIKTDKGTLEKVLKNGMPIQLEFLRDPFRDFS